MQVKPGQLSGLYHIYPQIYCDDRGFFLELFERERYQTLLGITDDFVQDNYSRSYANVLRGLHFQVQHPQGKLVQVLRGEIFDVAVDLRPDSPTYKQWQAVVLSAESGQQLWLPPGLAHGFAVLSAPGADVSYKCTSRYHAGDEACLRWDDPDLAIDWPLSNPILSEKDRAGRTWQQLHACGYC
ncbi:MAG: dTDP-4-dehydrorhamnose 3,5-epimerase [Plesiomonas shigelloides]